MLERYPDTVKLVFKNFPLRNHPFAMPAARAALAAGEQGKFWEYHDRVFENFRQLSDDKLVALARELELDVDRFEQDRKSRKIDSLIRRDMQEASRIGVRGTPTIFVNGQRLRQRSLQGFRAVIEQELAKPGTAQP